MTLAVMHIHILYYNINSQSTSFTLFALESGQLAPLVKKYFQLAPLVKCGRLT
jgi:hypothetical protein